jgi:hypothetical protein
LALREDGKTVRGSPVSLIFKSSALHGTEKVSNDSVRE